jgi:cytidyltransferase-like protein
MRDQSLLTAGIAVVATSVVGIALLFARNAASSEASARAELAVARQALASSQREVNDQGPASALTINTRFNGTSRVSWDGAALEIPPISATVSVAAAAAATTAIVSPTRTPVRVYVDGCFDMMHYGHANALRQAKATGDILVVGLVNDAEVVTNKGASPVMCEEERYAALVSCKFVDEVIRNAPYNLHKEWVDSLISDHGISFIVHGDDPCITADGQDACE